MTISLLLKSRKTFVKMVASLLKAGNVVGWFQGRSELGPRSLGARSVLADPRKISNKAKINQLLKKEIGLCLMPHQSYLKMSTFFKKFEDSPYMSFALKVDKNHKKIPAGIHVDGTSRPQAVFKSINKKFHTMISHFYKLTNTPAVLNTSFNRHGIATIVTPRNAVEHLLNECIDILAIEDFIVHKKKKWLKKRKK